MGVCVFQKKKDQYHPDGMTQEDTHTRTLVLKSGNDACVDRVSLTLAIDDCFAFSLCGPVILFRMTGSLARN